MKNIVVTLFVLLFFSCSKNERKEFYIDKVKKGMTTQEVKEILLTLLNTRTMKES